VASAAPPVLTVRVPRQTLAGVLRRGLRFRVACADACLISAHVTGPAPPRRKRARARAARIAVIGRREAALAASMPRTLRIRIRRSSRRLLRRRSRPVVRLTVRATPPVGSPGTSQTTTVRLRRARAHR
jgi:hypothetical protein